MKEIKKDKDLVAFCGLYCGACGKYLKDKCPGCKKNEKAAWCEIRKCCFANEYSSCADCEQFGDIMECKIFGLIFRSDRKACVDRIKEVGREKFSEEMADKKLQSIKKK